MGSGCEANNVFCFRYYIKYRYYIPLLNWFQLEWFTSSVEKSKAESELAATAMTVAKGVAKDVLYLNA